MLGRRLKEFRLNELGMGIRAFAEWLGVRASHVCNVERGRSWDARSDMKNRVQELLCGVCLCLSLIALFYLVYCGTMGTILTSRDCWSEPGWSYFDKCSIVYAVTMAFAIPGWILAYCIQGRKE